jgi:hypothetical protein
MKLLTHDVPKYDSDDRLRVIDQNYEILYIHQVGLHFRIPPFLRSPLSTSWPSPSMASPPSPTGFRYRPGTPCPPPCCQQHWSLESASVTDSPHLPRDASPVGSHLPGLVLRLFPNAISPGRCNVHRFSPCCKVSVRLFMFEALCHLLDRILHKHQDSRFPSS